MKKVVLNQLIIAAIAVSAAFTSCKDKPEPTGQKAVNLIADIKPASTLKVANDQWETGDKVGLFMKVAGEAIDGWWWYNNDCGSVYCDAANVQLSISGQTLVSNPPLMYPTNGNVDFIAYYPYMSDVCDSIYVKLGDQTDGLPIEILYSNNATNKAPTESPVILNFQYLLPKLEIVVTGGENSMFTATDFAAMNVVIDGMYAEGRFSLNDRTFENIRQWGDGRRNSIMLYKKGNTANSATFEALVMPTTEADGEVTFLFYVGGEAYQYKQKVNYASHNLYALNFALDFSSQSKAILLNTSITPRNENPPQNISMEATAMSKITMTTEASEVSLSLTGNGKIIIDWGDGTTPIYTFPWMLYYLSPYSYSGSSSHTISIIGGEDITQLYCWHGLTSLDVSKNTTLQLLICANNQFSTAALDALFESLHDNPGTKTIFIGNNPGTDACNRIIAIDKGWTVREAYN